jgi:hypothetical protein
MPYINVGAYDTSGEGHVRFKSKKALREAMKESPGTVLFDSTELRGNYVDKVIRGDELPSGVHLTVTGPDPYTARKWYADISPAGKIT